MIPETKRRALETLQHRLERAQWWLAVLQNAESRYPWIRLSLLLVGPLSVYAVAYIKPGVLPWVTAGLFLAAFVYVTRQHQAVIDKAARIETLRSLLKEQTARMSLDWTAIPAATQIPVEANHPFNADLNITGDRSLHQLLDTTISLNASHRLANWLLQVQPDPPAIIRRQTLVREMLQLPANRLRLELNGRLASPGKTTRWDGGTLLAWLESHTTAATLRPKLITLGLLAAANIVLFTLNVTGALPAYWLITFLAYFWLQAAYHRETSEVFEESYSLARQLRQLRAVLIDLEDYPYAAQSELRKAAAPLLCEDLCPSEALRRITRIVSAASLRSNPFLSLLLNILVPWDMFFAYRLEHYKADLQHVLPGWLEAWYEIDAIAALANFAAWNTENHFPAVLSADAKPVFTAEALRHPLIPDDTSVANNFHIEMLGEITIITGSNMSGKSTFLRTVGTSLVLAFAGSVVPARSLQTIPFRLFTSMNVSDSLNDGISFFYAEVRRLSALLKALEAPDAYPLFFLIDEIFRGTNNRERQLGSQAYTQALAGRNGCGLISTHDLELVHLAESIPLVHNKHFREDIQDAKMVFDYQIHTGASPTTNALKIMAMAGLPVPAGPLEDQESIKKA